MRFYCIYKNYINLFDIIIFLLQVVLDDLKTNPRLGNIYFSLLNLISNAVKNFKCVGKLIDRLLRTLEALLDNPHIDASSSFSVRTLNNCVLP